MNCLVLLLTVFSIITMKKYFHPICNSLHHIDKIQKHLGDVVEAGSLAVSIVAIDIGADS